MSCSSSSSDDIREAMVLDNGSHKIKAGNAGDDAPRSFFHCLVGHKHNQDLYDISHQKDFYVGDEAMCRRDILSMRSPLQSGIVTNWEDMEKIWDHVYTRELHVEPTDQGLLITEPPLNPRANREIMANVLFENFEVPRLFVGAPGNLAAYASGRGTCIILDIGETVTSIYPLYEGHTFANSTKRIDIGGKDLNEYLQKLLMDKGFSFTTFSELEDLRRIKELHCFVSTEKANKTNKSEPIKDTYFDLPDGTKLTVGSERISCPEALFDPSLIGSDCVGIQTLLYDALMGCDIDVRRDFFVNIFISGGSTMFPGLADRLTQELKYLLPKTKYVKVNAPPERKSSVWIGGSILASLSSFNTWWITKAEYDEYGPNIVHGRCHST